MCLLCREMYDARVPRLQRRLDVRHDSNRDNPEKRVARRQPFCYTYVSEGRCEVMRGQRLIYDTRMLNH